MWLIEMDYSFRVRGITLSKGGMIYRKTKPMCLVIRIRMNFSLTSFSLKLTFFFPTQIGFYELKK